VGRTLVHSNKSSKYWHRAKKRPLVSPPSLSAQGLAALATLLKSGNPNSMTAIVRCVSTFSPVAVLQDIQALSTFKISPLRLARQWGISWDQHMFPLQPLRQLAVRWSLSEELRPRLYQRVPPLVFSVSPSVAIVTSGSTMKVVGVDALCVAHTLTTLSSRAFMSPSDSSYRQSPVFIGNDKM
jgi:hypothetical protein